jgi:hypothetical protein
MLETLVQLPDSLADQATVGLELRLAGPAQADTALLSLEVSPTTHQAGRQVLQLCELNLQLALEAARTLREDVENQSGTIKHATLELLLEIAFLAG